MPALGAPLDFKQLEAQNIRIGNLATAPTTPAPVAGQMYYDSTSDTLFWYDGTKWVSASGGNEPLFDAQEATGDPAAPIHYDCTGKTSVRVFLDLMATPVSATQIIYFDDPEPGTPIVLIVRNQASSANFYVDIYTTYSGTSRRPTFTSTGNSGLGFSNANGIGSNGVLAFEWIDLGTTTGGNWGTVTWGHLNALPTLNALATNRPATANVTLSNFKLVNVTDPTAAQDAATKNYVDQAIGAIPPGSNPLFIYQGSPTTQPYVIDATGYTSVLVVLDFLPASPTPFEIEFEGLDSGVPVQLQITNSAPRQVSFSNASVQDPYTGASYQLIDIPGGKVTMAGIAIGPPGLGDNLIFMSRVEALRDATATLKGLVQLANDFGGTAAAPIVANLHLAQDTSIGYRLTTLTDPVDDQDAATKAYVDGKATGLTVKPPVRAATTANVTLSGPQTIDGVALVAGNRVLVKDQTSAAQNGLYVVAAGAWTRATDMAVWGDVANAYVWVEEGATQGDSGWVVGTINPNGTINTDPISWDKFSSAAQITAGPGIDKTGNIISANPDGTTIDTGGADNTLQVMDGAITAAKIADGAIDLSNGKLANALTVAKGGMLTGGATGQVLGKASATDRDLTWINVRALPTTLKVNTVSPRNVPIGMTGFDYTFVILGTFPPLAPIDHYPYREGDEWYQVRLMGSVPTDPTYIYLWNVNQVSPNVLTADHSLPSDVATMIRPWWSALLQVVHQRYVSGAWTNVEVTDGYDILFVQYANIYRQSQHAAGTSIVINASPPPAGHGFDKGYMARQLMVQVQDNATGKVELPDISVGSSNVVTITYGFSIAANSKLVTITA